jgi:hypothetical protein
MLVARIRIPSRKQARPINNVFVLLAVEEVWKRNGRRAFTVTINQEMRWSLSSFNTWLGDFIEVSSVDRGHGRAAQLAALLASETGGITEYLVQETQPEGTIYTPGHLPIESYRPMVEWLRVVMEGPFPRDEHGQPQTFNSTTGFWTPL